MCGVAFVCEHPLLKITIMIIKIVNLSLGIVSPGKAGGKATPSPLAASSSYKPTPGTIGNQSGSGMRVGLSRNERVKSLHQNIKNN